MVSGIFHPGSGLGNQLHRYVAMRVLALDKGYDFGVIGRFDGFKGNSFMNLDMGKMTCIQGRLDRAVGRFIPEDKFMKLWEEKINYYNPEFNFVEDNTIIDGEFQSEQYFGHRMKEIDKWLKVEPMDIPDDVCVIGFRGGEFYVFPELGLPKSYFDEGIEIMKKINPNMKFEVHTDDTKLARQFFPSLKVIHDIGINWRSMRYAKHAIIANSSFYIFPRLLRQRESHPVDQIRGGPITIAPRFWARRNTGEWSRPDNYYKSFRYI